MSIRKLLVGIATFIFCMTVLMCIKPGQTVVLKGDIINKYTVSYAIASVIMAVFGYCISGNKIKMSFCIIKDIFCNLKLIYNLAINDFKSRYASSNLGAIWNFVQPIVTVAIYVFVFQYGFKAMPVSNVPYVLWLVAGIIPWFFFSDILSTATNSLLEYTYLVKKVVFKIDILPMVKATTAVFVHIFFVFIGLFMYIINGESFEIYIVQVLYYSVCTLILAVGISYLTSAVVVFFRDLGQIVNILLQFGMWLTPIMWQVDILSPTMQKIIKLNPMYYITDGYRDAFYNNIWFWDKLGQTVYFWAVTIIMFIIGTIAYKKLEKHFADVL